MSNIKETGEKILDLLMQFSYDIENASIVDYRDKFLELFQQQQNNASGDATIAMLDDIISWEKDLAEYKSLEGILRERYKITKR